MNTEHHSLQMQVRDYELDLQGIVNNSVYFNYLEHARHQYLLDNGVDFEGLFEEGIAAVVMKAELNYKKSLRSKDRFVVETTTERQGRFKIIFNQAIKNQESGELVLQAKITAACINFETGKPVEVEW